MRSGRKPFATLEQLASSRAEGLTWREVAARHGYLNANSAHACWHYWLSKSPAQREATLKTLAARDHRTLFVLWLRANGWKYSEIAELVGVSRQRIYQIVVLSAGMGVFSHTKYTHHSVK